MRMESIDQPADGIVEDMVAFSDSFTIAHMRKHYDEAGSTLRWVESKVWSLIFTNNVLTASKPRLLQSVEGVRLLMINIACTHWREIIYETTAWDLTLNEDGAVNGIKVRMADGTSMVLKTNAVILAAGGFQGNKEMMAQYVGRDAHKFDSIGRWFV